MLEENNYLRDHNNNAIQLNQFNRYLLNVPSR